MQKRLTVVIPAYNTEKYLEHCLQTLLLAERKKDVQLLIVNDGSTDHTGQIAEQYASRYPELVTVIHKQNGGHGSAINAGIQQATGLYFKVVDSDDWVDTKAYDAFLEQLENLTCDLVVTPFVCVRNGKKEVRLIEGLEEKKGYRNFLKMKKKTFLRDKERLPEESEVLLFVEYASKLHVRMHEWTIRTDILKQQNITLAEQCFYVDMQYILFPIPWIKTFCVVDTPVYCYRLGEEGQSVSFQNMQKNRMQHQAVQHSLIAFYKEREKQQDMQAVLQYLANGIAKMQANQVQTYLSMPINKKTKNELIVGEQYLKEHCPSAYITNQKISIRLLRKSKYRLYLIMAVVFRIWKRGKR